MTVLAPDLRLPQTDAQLRSLLHHSQRVALEQGQPQILSFSQAIPALDPYAVLDQLSDPDEPRFSFGRSLHHPQGSLMVAAGALWQVTLQGAGRFPRAKQLSQQILNQCHGVGDPHPLAGPRILCSFSFFPTVPHGSPFPATTLFLPRWLIAQQGDRWIAVVNQRITPETHLRDLMIGLTHQMEQITTVARTGSPAWCPPQQDPHLSALDTQPLRQAICSVLERIHQHQIQKVVLSESHTLPLPHPLPLPSLLQRLHRIYPDCTVFSFSRGPGPTFLGASPERLLSLQRGCFMVDALAGSAPRGETAPQDRQLGQQLLTSIKDRHEHALVVASITQQLTRLGLESTLSSLPHLLKLSTIQHLHTPIHGSVPSHLSPLDLVAALHPTPAVAGTPTELACEQIRHWETVDRSLYAAPLGWLDGQGNGEFIVGIRSALLEPHQLRLFAGAGIVADSDPDREVHEIYLKLGALLQALTADRESPLHSHS